jgi:hypothetical protein
LRWRADSRLLNGVVRNRVHALQVVPDDAIEIVQAQDVGLALLGCCALIELNERGWAVCAWFPRAGEGGVEDHALVDVHDAIQVALGELPRVGGETALLKPVLLVVLPLVVDDVLRRYLIAR